MKKWHKILLIITLILIGLVIVKDQLIKATINTVGSSVVGAPLKVGKFSLGLFSQKISLKDIKLYNPEGFPKEPLIDIPEVRVDYDLPALIGGKLHLSLVILDLKEMVVVKNKEGQMNVDSLKVSQPSEKPKEEKKEEKAKKDSQPMPMQIDELRLNLGKVVYKDYTKGDQPVIEAFDVGFKDKVYKDIDSPQKLISIVLLESMKATSIQGAKIYAVASFLGPAGLAAGVLISDDDVNADFEQSFEKVYEVSLNLVKEIGELKSEDSAKGIIKAKVNGNDVTIQIKKQSATTTQVVISARKLMLPKPKVAGGVLHQLTQKLEP